MPEYLALAAVPVLYLIYAVWALWRDSGPPPETCPLCGTELVEGMCGTICPVCVRGVRDYGVPQEPT